MPHELTGHFLPVRQGWYLTYADYLSVCRSWFLCSLYFSFTFSFSLSL